MSDCRFGVSPVNYPDPDPDPDPEHSKKRVLQIFFSVSLVLFLFAITGNMDSNSTPNPTFPCWKCSSTGNIWFHAPCQRVGNMLCDHVSNSN